MGGWVSGRMGVYWCLYGGVFGCVRVGQCGCGCGYVLVSVCVCVCWLVGVGLGVCE